MSRMPVRREMDQFFSPPAASPEKKKLAASFPEWRDSHAISDFGYAPCACFRMNEARSASRNRTCRPTGTHFSSSEALRRSMVR